MFGITIPDPLTPGSTTSKTYNKAYGKVGVKGNLWSSPTNYFGEIGSRKDSDNRKAPGIHLNRGKQDKPLLGYQYNTRTGKGELFGGSA